jgi:hypothetical protein
VPPGGLGPARAKLSAFLAKYTLNIALHLVDFPGAKGPCFLSYTRFYLARDLQVQRKSLDRRTSD